MDTNASNVIVEGLISYLGLLILLTFHEFGHAWTALKCGDDTARLQGRVSLNPVVHIDPIGTVLLPLLMIFLSPNISRFMIGWAKPVPVNPYNLRNPRLDDILVSLAGPAMNLVLAVALMALGRAGIIANAEQFVGLCVRFASISLLLCFFNLIPIPPLDGSRILFMLLPSRYDNITATLNQYGPFILLAVVLLAGPLISSVTFTLTRFLLGY